MIARQAAQIILEKSKYYPVIAVTGPRQSGKSTLVRALFPNKKYINLEALDHREFASTDPRGFLSQFNDGGIIDEIQYCPGLFSYLQERVDEHKKMGEFVLTGSQQFALSANLSQSLAGRVGIVELLPFSFQELQTGNIAPITLEDAIFKGSYPPIYDRNAAPTTWYDDYIRTYVDKDIRQLVNIQNLNTFQTFVKMCAARTGQLLNLTSLANDCGITHVTASKWISLLQTSYIAFLLEPYHVNFNKRLVKTPKIYFHDTGLVCRLLGIHKPEDLIMHSIRGHVFETWVISEMIKNQLNKGERAQIYFWRDSQGHEVDAMINQGLGQLAIEIKAGKTITTQQLAGLRYWQKLSNDPSTSYLIYAGDTNQNRPGITILPWQNMAELFKKLV